MKEPQLISVVVPCYNEEAALPHFLDALRTTAAELYDEFSCRTELLFVDDGSADGTLSVLRDAARKNDNVRYLSFSRNFGKEAAMYAGLQRARGDYVVVMDADLQHPPSMLREMVATLRRRGACRGPESRPCGASFPATFTALSTAFPIRKSWTAPAISA